MDGPKKRDQQPQFDPKSSSLLKVYRMSGEDGLRERLGEIEEIRHLQALAKAQQISVPPSLRGKDADLSRLKDAIVRGVISRDGQRTPAEPGTQQVTISLRVPAELKARLEERATTNHRNLSQEAERALERSFSAEALFVDSVRAMEEPPNRIKRAGEYVRDLAIETYGHRIGTLGHWLMSTLGIMDAATDKGRIAVYAEDIAFFRNLIMDLERNAAIVEKGNAQGSEIVEPQHGKSLPAPVLAVRDAMRLHIATGTWKVNAAIPAMGDLVNEFGVNLSTVIQALELMERDGLIVRRAGEALRKTTRPIFLVAPAPRDALRA
jgi:predicted transcriptional regulator